ncbi:unnamed protein product [Cylicostephanus goldi]|uniref:Uncharacterized protein n=1 Tax=Cylicostephanus goldi TaxID=71465 RepID=A0A3P6S161_CYLGO|nr:unnamed protein product [Cylicostephanus goldi]
MELFVQRKKRVQEVHENGPFAKERKAREEVRAAIPLHSLDHVQTFLKIVREEENVMGELQRLNFTTKFPLHDYKLIQIPRAMLKDVTEGQK